MAPDMQGTVKQFYEHTLVSPAAGQYTSSFRHNFQQLLAAQDIVTAREGQ
jgi:hypothetical protein